MANAVQLVQPAEAFVKRNFYVDVERSYRRRSKQS